MTDHAPAPGDGARGLRFACACASAVPIAEDPWVAISQQRKLNDGTKELIFNLIYRQSHTITQLAELLGISAPAVHRHITELLASELVREVIPPEDARRWPVERYYEPNFPVVRAADRALLQSVLANVATDMAAAFQRHHEALADAFAQTSLPARGESFTSLRHYVYATAARLARERLEAEGALPPW